MGAMVCHDERRDLKKKRLKSGEKIDQKMLTIIQTVTFLRH